MALDTGELPAEPWPPALVDLTSDDWVTPGQATGIARVKLRTIRRWVKKYPISVLYGGRRYVSKRRLKTVLVTLGHRDRDAA